MDVQRSFINEEIRIISGAVAYPLSNVCALLFRSRVLSTSVHRKKLSDTGPATSEGLLEY